MDILKVQEMFLFHLFKNVTQLEVLGHSLDTEHFDSGILFDIYRIFHNIGSGAAMAEFQYLSELARISETWIEPRINHPDKMSLPDKKLIQNIIETIRSISEELQAKSSDGAKIATPLMSLLGNQIQKAKDDGFSSNKTKDNDH